MDDERTGRGGCRRVAALLLLPVLAGCGVWSAAGAGCRVVTEPAELPEALLESSGVAVASASPDVFWSHSDGGPGRLHAVDAGGRLLATVPVRTGDRRADRRGDWEDLASAPCGAGTCLYIADTGNNEGVRPDPAILRLPEPDLPTPGAAPEAERPGVTAERLPVRFSTATPPDVEAVFVLPGERIYLVSKGRREPVSVWRYPPPLRPDSAVLLEEVQRLSDGPRVLPRQVTGAAASPDGSTVALRTYEALRFYRFGDDGLTPIDGASVNLRTLREGQGEAVALGRDGLVVLTSEAGPSGSGASIVVMRCEP